MWPLIGYLPKQPITRARWAARHPERDGFLFPAPENVEQICSVSTCISGGPEFSMDEVPFNPFGLYEGPVEAWKALATEENAGHELFAYKLAPLRFSDGKETPFEFEPCESALDEAAFERLGYDAVQCQDTCTLGCSPLSCNGQTEDVLLNRYFLVDTVEQGMELAKRFSISNPEPGPYGVVEVWRQRGQR